MTQKSLLWRSILLLMFIFPLANSAFALEREYLPKAVLTEEEEKKVIQLAEKHGIKNVEKISTAYLAPSSWVIINVREKEKIEGRDVTYRMIQVKCKKWYPAKEAAGKEDLSVGEFWSAPPGTVKHKILLVDKKKYRAEVRNVTVEQCERVLEVLQKGKYTVTDAVKKDHFEHIDFQRPTHFSYDLETKRFHVGFCDKSDRYSWFIMKVILDGDGVQILEILNIMA